METAARLVIIVLKEEVTLRIEQSDHRVDGCGEIERLHRVNLIRGCHERYPVVVPCGAEGVALAGIQVDVPCLVPGVVRFISVLTRDRGRGSGSGRRRYRACGRDGLGSD